MVLLTNAEVACLHLDVKFLFTTQTDFKAGDEISIHGRLFGFFPPISCLLSYDKVLFSFSNEY